MYANNKFLSKKKIALVTVSNALTQSPPINLLCLSTILESEGYSTDIFDLHVSPTKKIELFTGIQSRKYIWVGFTSITPSIPLIKEYIDKIRQIDSRIPILLGGIHASSLPEQSLREFEVDAVCIGDGESASVAFTHKILQNETDYWAIPGIAALDKEGNYHFSEKMASSRRRKPLPRPNWEKIDIKDYQKCPLQYIRRRKIIAPIIIAKGCPNKCTFCAVPAFSGRKLLHRDPIDIVDEIEYLVKKKHVEEIQIFDDNFNCNLSYAKRVLREWIKRNINIVWKAPVGFWIHSYDEEWFSLLVQTGCYQVGFGIESGSPEILKNVNKSIKLEKISSILQMYRNYKISTFGFFILGLPGENKKTIAQTIRFACSLPLNHIHVSLLTPYPGSPIFHQALKQGLPMPGWEAYNHYHEAQNFRFCEVSIKELRRAMQSFYLRFYSYPRHAFNLINDIRHSGLRPFLSLTRKIFSL